MNLKWLHVIFALLINANALSNDEIIASIQMTGFDYEESCFKAAESQWNFNRNPNNDTLQSWINATIEYGILKNNEIDGHIKDLIDKSVSNATIKYKYNLVSKPGDALLISEGNNSWPMLIDFIGKIEYFKLSKSYSNTLNENALFREDADNLLSRSGTVDYKLKTWNNWYQMLMPLTNEFSNNMRLIQKAATANDANDVTEYWEMLSEYKDGYVSAKNKWNEISLLHSKIVKFVKTRLTQKYGNSIEDDTLPPHLLGSLQGYDWTPLVLDVIPYTSIIYEMRKSFLKKGLVSKNLYKLASRLANAALKHVPEANFFNESDFQGQCPSKLINLCDKGRMRISTCSHPSITNYLSAHKNIAKVLIHQMSEQSNPILNFANRYSALEEGVAELFGILSVRDFWLQSLHLVNETDDIDNIQIVSLMITALDVLPRLAYYHGADMWRIDSIKNNTLEPKDLIESWWQYRSLYEGITINSTKLPTFMDDTIIINNRPYLSKYIGIILAFQIHEYLWESADMKFNKIETIPINHNLIKMIQHRCADNWYEVIEEYLEFDDISVDPLLTYFTPLEQYIDDYETENSIAVSDELVKKIEKLEDEFEMNIKVSVTTTTTIKTTVSSVPKNFTTKTSSVNRNGSYFIVSKTSEKLKNSTVKPILNSEIQADASQPPEQISKTIISDNNNNIEEEKIKGTTKAIWAVSAVLIAIIAIIIIAIFGRQRCRKTPKNRRYV